MSKHSNILGMPDILYNAFTFSSYTKGEGVFRTATGLDQPPRLAALEDRYGHMLVSDAVDHYHTVFGSAVHKVIEQAGGQGIAEQRFYMELGGERISGAPDYIDTDGRVHDWKTVKWEAIQDGCKPEWERQLNCYAMLARENDVKVTGLTVWAFLKNWSRDLPNTNPDCPKHPVVRFDVELHPDEHTRAYYTERVRLHKAALTTLPDCTEEERWCTPAHYACKKPENKRARKRHENEADAQRDLRPGEVVEYRPGVSVRCRSWCPVSEVCEQYQKRIQMNPLWKQKEEQRVDG